MEEKHKCMFGLGNPNDAYKEYFVGNSYLNPLTEYGECPVFLANVTFEPRCRNNWHIHHATSGGGQILICTDGEGWYQEEGKEAVSLYPGKVITIPANGYYCMPSTVHGFSHFFLPTVDMYKYIPLHRDV